MKRVDRLFAPLLWLAVPLLLISGCGDDNTQPSNVTKADLHAAQAAGEDVCALVGQAPGCDPCTDLSLYGDGLCDADLIHDGVCPGPDPDCDPTVNGCQADVDCAQGQVCAMACPVGGDCVGSCIEITAGCQDDADCAPNQRCVLSPDSPVGTCMDESGACNVDTDCDEGSHCEIYCGNGWCQGVCTPTDPGCQADSECAPDEACQVYCGNGWCAGVCADVWEE